jgi:1,4-dihydroxy-2-naphthoyl-CoA hydrolase
MFIYDTKIRLHHTDAANLIFYSKLFNLAYECYEDFLEINDFSIPKILDEKKILVPVVHAEADYIKPIKIGDKIKIQMSLNKLGNSSYTLIYDFYNNKNNEKVAQAKTIHVLLNYDSYKPEKIPEKLREILLSLNS